MKSSSSLYLIPHVLNVCLWLLLLTTTVHAQTVATPDSEEQHRRAQVQALERQQVLQQPRVHLPVQPNVADMESWPEEAPCFTLKQLRLDAADQLPENSKQAAAHELPLDLFYFASQYLQNYVGRCAGHDGVNLIVRRLGNLILQNGYSTTRVGIPAQDMSQGELRITLVPGMIHSIRINDASLYGTWRNAFPTEAGRVLNLRDLEQGLEQMKRLTSEDVSMQIVPAEKPGESDVLLQVARNRSWKLSTTLDNSGAKSTGKLQASANLVIENPLGLSDVLTLGINNDADRSNHGTKGKNLSYAIPYGYWNSSLSVNDSEYYQQIAGKNTSYISSGQSRTAQFKLSQVVERDQQQKNSWQFNLGKRWAHSYFDDAEIDVQKRDVTFVELGWTHKHYFNHGQLDVTLAGRWGTSWLGGQQDRNNRPNDEPTFSYALQTLDATLSEQFQLASLPLTYLGTLRAQTSGSALYLSDQFSIGGPYTVRGFDGELTLTAERGFFLRNEISVPIAHSSHAVYAGLDVGKVFGRSVPYLVGDTLAGATLGVRGSWQHFFYDVFAGWPVYQPEQFATTTPTVGLTITLFY